MCQNPWVFVTGRHWRRTRHTPGASDVRSSLTRKSSGQEPILGNFWVKTGRKGTLPSDPGKKKEEEPETTGTPKETTAPLRTEKKTWMDLQTAHKQEDIEATSRHLKKGRTGRQYSKTPATLWEERVLHRCVGRVKPR
ncbi:hypothetical protein NDU88_005127 [Pleurodeles waltl]|uniref:Uncharacterized protein n=1 Tax=Pleurodeles waltl TaxID=8319 RepID=A0AAV7MDP0_PLEWA|nr:hypothetical protein NDU88_005127 [Pleurodeles waltl]